MTAFEPASYGPVLQPLLEIDRSRALDAGRPNISARGALEGLTAESAFGERRVTDRKMAECCLAGLWLLHDFLDRSHEISQEIETPTGSYWHAVMHRREGDYSNAKYWLRRVGTHPVFEPLASCVAQLAAEREHSTPRFLADRVWEPFAFVDACQAAVRSGSDADFCCAVQQAEWELLFDYCFQSAT